VLPPSRLADGGSYAWLSDASPAPFPAWVAERLAAAPAEREKADLAKLYDNPANLERAREMLRRTDPTDDGFVIACRLTRDLALPVAVAIEPFEEWNAGSNGNGNPTGSRPAAAALRRTAGTGAPMRSSRSSTCDGPGSLDSFRGGIS
jgi:hypothetical protein